MTRDVNTTDLTLAATLRCLGYQLDDIMLNGRQGTFCFLDVSDDDLRVYDLGGARVEPITFNGHVKALTTATKRKY